MPKSLKNLALQGDLSPSNTFLGISLHPFYLLLAFLLFSLPAFSEYANVQAKLTDGSGSVAPTSFLHFELENCGVNFPTSGPGNLTVTLTSFDLKPNQPDGTILGQVLGNDTILCGNVASTYYHITPMKNQNTPLGPGQDYVLCASATMGSACYPGVGGTWNPALAQPMTQPAPAPGFILVFQNPIQSQRIKQPVNTTMVFTGAGSFDFTTANLIMPQKADLVGGLVPTAELGTGIASSTTCLLGNHTWGACGVGSTVAFQVNGVATAVQSLVNFKAGTNMTITADAFGGITFDATGGGGSGDVFQSPTAGTNQIINQLPNGAGTTQSTFGSNSFNNIWYAPPPVISTTGTAAIPVTTIGANYSQSPSSPTTISAGSTTVTFPNGCPIGIATPGNSQSAFQSWTYAYIAGTGTPEPVKITSTTCPLFGGGAAGTVTFTAANSHSAGYTIASASNGLQETINNGLRCMSGINCAVVKGRAAVIVPPGDYTVKARVSVVGYSGMDIDFTSSAIICQVSDTCVYVGDTSAFNSTSHSIRNIAFLPGIANGNFIALEDNGQAVHFDGISFGPNTAVANSSFGVGIQIDKDESFDITRLNTAGGGGSAFHCGAAPDFCSVGVKLAGVTPAPTGVISVSNLAMGCKGNGVDNQGGNSLRISDSQIQAYNQFGVRSVTTFNTNLNLQLDDVYEEIGSCVNPDGTGISGYVLRNGPTIANGMVGPSGKLPAFINTGTANKFQYYVIVLSGSNKSVPYLVGFVNSTLSTGSPVVKWPQIGTTGTITYDVLRTQGTGLPFVPYTAICTGGSVSACGSVATGLTVGAACANGVCSFTDDISVSTSSYTIPALPAYIPDLTGLVSNTSPMPGTIVLSGAENAGATSATFATWTSPALPVISTTHVSSAVPSGPIQAAGNNFPTIYGLNCVNNYLWSPVWIQCQGSGQSIGFVSTVHALNDNNGASIYGTKGKTIYAPAPNATLQGSHIVTLIDSCPTCTLSDPSSTLYRQTPWTPTDSYIAIDNAVGAVVPTAATLGIGTNNALRFYIGTNPDGTSFKLNLTASLFDSIVASQFESTVLFKGVPTAQVPMVFTAATAYLISGPEVSKPASPAAGTQRMYFKSGSGLCSVDSAGTEFCPGGTPSSGYATIQVAGSPITQRTIVNFVSGMACVDNSGATSSDCTVTGGGSAVTVNSSSVSNPNFNNTTPAAGAGFLNCTWTFTGSNVALKCPTGTSSSTFALGNAAVTVNTTAPVTINGTTSSSVALGTSYTLACPSCFITNPASAQIAQPSSTTGYYIFRAGAGAAAGQPVIDIQDSTGTSLFTVFTNGQVQIGKTGSAANMIMTGTSANTDSLGRLTLSGGAGSYSFSGTYTTAPGCFFRDETTPANAVTTQTVSTTTITVAGTGTDVILYHCSGFN